MTHVEAVEAAAEPIRRHLAFWNREHPGRWTAATVAENLRRGSLGGCGAGPSYQFERDAIYVHPTDALPQRGQPGVFRIPYAEAIAAASGAPQQSELGL